MMKLELDDTQRQRVHVLFTEVDNCDSIFILNKNTY